VSTTIKHIKKQQIGFFFGKLHNNSLNWLML